MLASFIICQACGCKGRAGNTLPQNQAESPAFRYDGHDPFQGLMHYSCTNCQTKLLVDPMDMLTSLCVRGVPEGIHETIEKNSKKRIILQTGRIVEKIPQKIPALKYHI